MPQKDERSEGNWILETDGRLLTLGLTITIEKENLYIDDGEYLHTIPLAGLYALLGTGKKRESLQTTSINPLCLVCHSEIDEVLFTCEVESALYFFCSKNHLEQFVSGL